MPLVVLSTTGARIGAVTTPATSAADMLVTAVWAAAAAVLVVVVLWDVTVATMVGAPPRNDGPKLSDWNNQTVNRPKYLLTRSAGFGAGRVHCR
jgi:hypothetical protein